MALKERVGDAESDEDGSAQEVSASMASGDDVDRLVVGLAVGHDDHWGGGCLKVVWQMN